MTSSTRNHFPSDPIPRSIIDFRGVAGLIDTVASADPGHLKLLLQVLRTSEECLEARVVVELALRCRDPLAPLATLCRDALQTAADFNLLLRSSGWTSVWEVCPNARATALLNLCDETLAETRPRARDRRRRCGKIRSRLVSAASEEQGAQRDAFGRIEAQRDAWCPNYRHLFRLFLASVSSDRA